ncbi:MAG TPA: hypothetical protein DIW48_07290 [Sphaerochaeta sp.]|nr:hypothetical protein [Sphaerochaeta sp.]
MSHYYHFSAGRSTIHALEEVIEANGFADTKCKNRRILPKQIKLGLVIEGRSHDKPIISEQENQNGP